MANPKYVSFIQNLESVIERNGAKTIKQVIGDSTHNHRTPTVNQVIRFLTRRNASKNQRVLGRQLKEVYSLFKYKLSLNRSESNNRVDAYDVRELISIYKNLVVASKHSTYRAYLSRRVL